MWVPPPGNPYRGTVPRHRSLQLAALATVAVTGLDVVATRTPQKTSADFEWCGLLDSAGRHWIVQAPVHAAAAAALDSEAEVLRALAAAVRDGRLPFGVPTPEGSAATREGWRVIVYRELAGRELDLDVLAPGPGPTVSLGRAIAAIHELEAHLFAEAGLPVYDAEGYRARRLAEFDDAARTGLIPPVLLTRWERALEDVSLWRFSACPVHGDLAPENVLVSNGQVSAVLNWANAHVGDPAEDLAWLYAAAPEACLDTLEESYAMARSEPPDAHLVDRALLYSELAVARWLLHGVRIGSPEIIADGERMLTDLARHVAGSAPIGQSSPTIQQWEVAGSLDPGTSPSPAEELQASAGPSPASAPVADPLDAQPSPSGIDDQPTGEGTPVTRP